MRRRKLQPVEQRCVERLSILLHLSRSCFKTDFSQKKALNAELKNSVYAGFGASSFVLGNELWEEHFESLLALVSAVVVMLSS